MVNYLKAILLYIDISIKNNNIIPITVPFYYRVQNLIEGVEFDLDKPLDDDA